MMYLVIQIFFCLLLAALLGSILGWLWRSILARREKDERIAELERRLSTQADSGSEWRAKLEQCQASNRQKEARIAELEQRLATPTLQSTALTAQEAAAAAAFGARPAEIDDLKKIYGVGPKLEKLLHGLGVFTFRQVANWSPADIEWVDTELEEFPGRIIRDDWVGGARKEHRKEYGEDP